MFVGHSEQVALVVHGKGLVGTHPDQAIDEAVAVADNDGTGDHRIHFRRQCAHPAHGHAVHGLGIRQGVVGEAAGEGFRQHDQIGAAHERSHQIAIHHAIGLGVVPMRCRLHQGDAQVGRRHGHRFSPP
jgi:hypothetical protein